jgi:hypothetical protein
LSSLDLEALVRRALLVVAWVVAATLPSAAQADWAAHVDFGGGRRLGEATVGQIALRTDMLLLWSNHGGIGPAAEARLLHPGLGGGLAGFFTPDFGKLGFTSTVVAGYASGGSGGGYLAGTLAAGWRDYSRDLELVPSPNLALYVSVMHRLDGSSNEVVVGLQMDPTIPFYLGYLLVYGLRL